MFDIIFLSLALSLTVGTFIAFPFYLFDKCSFKHNIIMFLLVAISFLFTLYPIWGNIFETNYFFKSDGSSFTTSSIWKLNDIKIVVGDTLYVETDAYVHGMNQLVDVVWVEKEYELENSSGDIEVDVEVEVDIEK